MRDVLCRAYHFLLSAKLADDDVAPTTQFRFAVREKKVLCSALIWSHLLLSVGTSMGRDVRPSLSILLAAGKQRLSCQKQLFLVHTKTEKKPSYLSSHQFFSNRVKKETVANVLPLFFS